MTPGTKRGPTAAARKKRGEKHGSLLSGEPVGEENVKIIDDNSPPVLQGKEGHKKKRSLPLGSTKQQ